MYKDKIQELIVESPLEIDTEIEMKDRPPTMASSEFLTNKEQGDWAENIIHKAINENSTDYFSVKYGRAESIAAGDKGFAEFYSRYQKELNTIGKRPDLLIFRVNDFPSKQVDIENDKKVRRAVAALEVRSSSFLVEKYASFMQNRQESALTKCKEIQGNILNSEFGQILKRKSGAIYEMLLGATEQTFRDIDFRLPSWSLTQQLRELKEELRKLKANIKTLHKRDYLSITPKLEDIALVNRWIQTYNVRHFYLQVFFDKAYIISFKNILELVSDDNNEETNFSIERDVKNQGKTTIKVNVKIGKEVLGKIDMPEHASSMKELDRGRLLFYVTFEGGKGYLDEEVFMRDIVNA